MFIDNKYTKIYLSIVQRYQTIAAVGRIEHHHIIPRSMGGSNRKENVVALSPKAHFVCHHLLTKMTDGPNQIKMLHAFWRMVHSPQHAQPITAKVYHSIRSRRAALMSQQMQGPGNTFYGKTHKPESRERMSRSAQERCAKNGHPAGGFKTGSVSWNAGLTKETNGSVKSMSAKKIGINNPMYGKSGADHPNTVSFKLYDADSNKIAVFESRRSFSDYCREKNFPCNGLYKTLQGKKYHDGSKNKRYAAFNGWYVSV